MALLAVTLATPSLNVFRSGSDNVLQWTVSNTKLDSFRIEKKVDAGAWGTLTTKAAGDRTHTDASVTTPATYTYRVVSIRGGRERTSNESLYTVTGDATLLVEADLTYLGAYDLPSTVSGVGVSFNEAPIAFRNGSMLHVTADQPVRTPGADVFQVTIPTLLTSAPYNTATVTKTFGNVYQAKKQTPSIGTYRWTYCMYCDPDNWDDLYCNFGGYYSASDSTSPSLCRITLNDTASTGTAEAEWGFTGVNNRWTRSGCLRMPAAFVTANCPGKPFMIGAGGAYFANAGGSSCGPCGVAIARPDIVTNPNQSSLGSTPMWGFPYTTPKYGPPIRGRRPDDYGGGLFGVEGDSFHLPLAGATASSVTLPTSVYDSDYAGLELSITSGANTQTVTLGAKTGTRTFGVTWTNGTPEAGVSFEAVDPTGVRLFNDEWEPASGIGYYTLGDRIAGGMAWVRGNPRGILVFVARSTGLQFYGPGGPHYQHMQHHIELYDEDDIASAMAGSINNYQISPVATWDIQIPGLTYPNTSRSSQGWSYRIGGVAYDDTNRKVYVAVNNQRPSGAENVPRIHCWQIGGSN